MNDGTKLQLIWADILMWLKHKSYVHVHRTDMHVTLCNVHKNGQLLLTYIASFEIAWHKEIFYTTHKEEMVLAKSHLLITKVAPIKVYCSRYTG